MPEEGKAVLESEGKFVKEVYINSKGTDEFWMEDSKSYDGKPEKETLGSFVFKDCDDERVILLMGSDCSTEDLMMDDDVLSDWSSEVLFNIDNVTNLIISDEKLNAFVEDHREKTKISQDECNEAEVTNRLQSPVIVANSSSCTSSTEHIEFHDQVNEDIISYNNELDKEVQPSVTVIQQYSGTLPYSGSISLRSTSSNASTQSFAFPILTQECTSSPARMPKPHKRQWKIKMCWLCYSF